MSNGLIRRTFRLAPNAATIGLDHLTTGQALLRGVKPEAIIEIDGERYEVGGLKGQPNYAYLDPTWVPRLRSDPRALQFTAFEVGAPMERLAWKRVRHHAPDALWPPVGVHLRMDYQFAEPALDTLRESPRASNVGRIELLTDRFDELTDAWRVHASEAHERSSFENEGKVGEIYTPANTCVFVERSLPAGTRLVEAEIDTGTDRSASWGPGIALVWLDRTIKINLRPGESSDDNAPMISVWDGRGETLVSVERQKLDNSLPWTLRLRVEDHAVYCEARPEGGGWQTCQTILLETPLDDPQAVRVGKLDQFGGDSDFAQSGELARLRILRFAAYSGLTDGALAAARQELEYLKRVRVSVHYELYDGLPCISKWITVRNESDRAIRIDRFTSEILATVEYSSHVEDRGIPFPRPNLHVQTDYAFAGMTYHNAMRKSVHWVSDPDYKTQVNYLRRSPCLLEVRPELGPAQLIDPGGVFESFHAFELVFDSTERERNGLAVRKMHRTISPWVTENPLMMHVRYADWDTVRSAIDQCAEVGFEMVILTFGSGFNIENESDDYLAEMTRYADYAREKGVEIGGYSLLASRRVSGGHDVVMPEGQRPTFGNSPCLGSEWGQDYFRKLYQFYEKTGFALLEHDGSYPGDACTASHHPGHRGYDDSRWSQWRMITDYYKWCRGNGVYLNVPDWYYLSGSNKSGMGYRETNWSLPRPQQVIHTHQNIFDGTWEKTPSMGWMFVPLTQYHGGGAAATIEPLRDHLDHYERMLVSNLALGVQACYRGPRLFDGDETMQLVKEWVNWFKQYRDILESDVVHGRRADGRDIDWMLHVNPQLKHKAMLVVFNPLERRVEKSVRVNLYYTGLTETARISREGAAPETVRLGRDYCVELPVTVEPRGMTWLVIE
ncbi:MAG: hypothetical protein KAS72_09750 [Phycisphaerales bacterium]|nr:hypothetical protein [Phycisphaerales bacterium]